MSDSRYGSKEADDQSSSREMQPLNVEDIHRMDLDDMTWDKFMHLARKSKVIQQRLIILGVMLIMLFLWMLAKSAGDDSYTVPASYVAVAGRSKPRKKFNLKSIDKMIEAVATEEKLLAEQLQKDYGKVTYTKMFQHNGKGEPEPVGRSVLRSASEEGRGWSRVKRKLTMKVLQALQSRTPQSFVWGTGGESLAAGHGNLFNQSYTAIMENSLQNVLGAAGLQFEGRNYAMGGIPSAPEPALCIDAIYGLDIDVLSWHFGLSHGKVEGVELYFYRAGLNPNRPVAVGIDVNDRPGTLSAAFKTLDDFGLPALFLDDAFVKKVMFDAPESSGVTTKAIEASGPKIRYFKCDGQFELGEPFCGAERFDQSVCPNRRFQTSLHPGWKWHALIGNLLALSLIELLKDALKDIQSAQFEKKPYNTLLAELKAQEDNDYDLFKTATLPSEAGNIPLSQHNAFDMTTLFKKRNICHTALLPSESRFKGILMPHWKKIGFFSEKEGYTGYDQGIDFQRARQQPHIGKEMRLTFSSAWREQCEVPLNQDFKDYFLVQGSELWQQVTIPNDAELKAYGTGNPLEGIIAICLAHCTLGHANCYRGDIRESDVIAEGHVDITINGVIARNFTLWDTCLFPYNNDGFTWKANPEGRFDIEVNVIKSSDYIRFSSLVVW